MHTVSRSFAVIAALAAALAASPAVAAECGKLTRLMTLDLLTLPSGRPGVSLLLGDIPEIFLVDTGGSRNTITAETVAQLNLSVSHEMYRGMKFVNGTHTTAVATVPSVTLGGQRFEQPGFFVIPRGAPAGQQEIAGALAIRSLANYDADFDFGQNRLNFFSRDHCEGTAAYWKAASVAVVPFHVVDDSHIVLRVTLDGEGMNAVLDTGAADTTLNLDVARRDLGIDTDAPDVKKVGQMKSGGPGFIGDVYRKRFKALAFGGVTVRDLDIRLIPDFMRRPDERAGEVVPPLIIGMPVLKRLHVYIAYGEKKLYLSPADPPEAGNETPPP